MNSLQSSVLSDIRFHYSSYTNNRRNVSNSKPKPTGDYDELSDLCKQLIEQQKSLQDEVKKQAQVIEVGIEHI